MEIKISDMIYGMFFSTSILFVVTGSTTVTHSEVTEYFLTLTELYSKSSNGSTSSLSVRDFIPKNDTDEAMQIRFQIEMFSLNDFDEVSGSLDITIAFNMSWRDEISLCNGLTMDDTFPLKSGSSFQSLLVPHGTIWTPNLVLVNSVGSLENVGGSAFRQRFNLATGQVTWNPMVKVQSACSPDVTYYPYDRQTCKFTFIGWGYTGYEVIFEPYKSTWDISAYEENGEWTLIETKSETSGASSDSEPMITLTITIQRKPLYFAFNIILPILVLAVLNGMVFWLPVDSGERVGFSVTCFLSFVVLLNMIMEILPRSSSPIAYLCFYVVSMMVFSGLNTGFVILQMKLYHKPETDEVPECIIHMMRFLKCKYTKDRKMSCSCIKSRENNQSKTDHQGEKIAHDPVVDFTEEDESGIVDISWQDVACFLDKFFFIAFFGFQILFTVCFLLPIASRA